MSRDDHRSEPSRNPHAMNRRQFVKLTTQGMLTVGLLTACSDDDDDTPTTPDPDPPSPPEGVVSPESFPQSVATGDPRQDSVIFWTRAVNAAAPTEAVPLTLLVAMDAELTNIIAEIELEAMPEFDHVAKLKLGALSPGTTYYYRFQFDNGTDTLASRTGRTKTAPAPEDNADVKFAFMSCQDYRGRWYNTLQYLSTIGDVDFVVHLGDYIYETTGQFDAPDDLGGRVISFSEPQTAIPVDASTLAARSISNYRDLYKTYRADPALQAVHEQFPMICIWDDHEFSNDSWGVTGTYFNAVLDESDVDRKRNSERVWAEYMPADYGLNGDGELIVGDEALYPNTRIYRDFQFGSNLHLLVTDYRTYRPDHIIPEDAFPGTVVADQATLTGVFAAQGVPFEAVAQNFFPYVNIDDPNLAPYKQVLTGVLIQQLIGGGLGEAEAQQRAVGTIQGNIATFVANAMLTAFNEVSPQPLPLIQEEGLPVGFAYFMLGKADFFSPSGLGSRYFVVKSAFDLYAGLLFQLTQGQSENVWGADQENWLLGRLSQSTTTWRVIGNSTSMTSMNLDLSTIDFLPDQFRQNFYLNIDQWDGCPNKRATFLGTLAAGGIGNTVMIAGDIHNAHAANHGNGVFEFTAAGISSSSFKSFMRSVVQGPPFDAIPGAAVFVENMEALMIDASPVINEETGEKQMRYTRSGVNGFSVIEVNDTDLTNTFYHLDEAEVFTNQYADDTLPAKFQTKQFRAIGTDLEEIF
ncbi:alkaline phosphatase D family protein [Acanthopleuribacter pedis]|uniref:Alkaline phosphatase D family protein n=1 Tax=Acanthopleuribacter pedis TaxID=442870 RepID=A0A8J7QLR1_9BACT|nr:alkaline phosphatase D family protein [Acanthopleuribacter pedis]MBO1320290.1 alkaline phosphatase D family protein [Acanthopleuribacter pedis]